MSDDPHEKIVTWNDVYYQTVGLSEEAAGQMDSDWGEEGVCTYEKGYFDQPVYSCITCSEIAGRPIGVCYGCYLECHLGHENVVELFSRRQFRCDCPTLSGTICDCSLNQSTEPAGPLNPKNKYNCNFEGIFCWCKRGYSADSNATMIECFLCEDWFHSTCIQQDKSFIYPLTESDDIFVCKDCLDSAPTLKHYSHLQASLDLSPALSSTLETSTSSSVTLATSSESQSSMTPSGGDSLVSTEKSVVPPSTGCILPKTPTLISTHALFKPNWEKELCKCDSCREKYEKEKILWILDIGASTTESGEFIDIISPDTTGLTLAQAVENAKKRKREPASLQLDVYSAGIEAFQSLPHHEAKGDVLHAYDVFAAKLETFFKEAAEQGKVLTEKDIREFFSGLKGARKYLR